MLETRGLVKVYPGPVTAQIQSQLETYIRDQEIPESTSVH